MKIQIDLFTISSKELFYSAGVESRDFLSKFAETIPNQSNMGNWEKQQRAKDEARRYSYYLVV